MLEGAQSAVPLLERGQTVSPPPCHGQKKHMGCVDRVLSVVKMSEVCRRIGIGIGIWEHSKHSKCRYTCVSQSNLGGTLMCASP